MAKISGVINLTGIIAPTDTDDTYAVTDTIYGRDGLRNVGTIQDMLAITADRRRLGMMVGVGVSGNDGTYYYLANNPESDTTNITDWKIFQAGGALAFYNQGQALSGQFSKVNFVGEDVLAQPNGNDADMVNVFIPAPNYASHFNSNLDGTTDGRVSESITRRQVRISSPTTEGTPFRTGGWAGSTQAATNSPTVIFSTADAVTGQGGDANLRVEIFNADNTRIVDYTTPAITQATTFSTTGITVVISNFATDAVKRKAVITVTVNMATVFGSIVPSQTGGRYYVKITNKTDSTTDGGTLYVYQQQPVFFDANPTSPEFQVGSTRTINEPANTNLIVTKHLSGVEYYTLNSRFEVSISNITGINGNTQGRSLADNANFSLTATDYGLPDINERAWSPALPDSNFVNWNNIWNNSNQLVTYSNTNWRISAQNHRYRGTAATATAQVFDPWANGSPGNTSPLKSILVDTYGITSTRDIEYFDDEDRRLESDYVTGWTSSDTLQNGEACVVGGNLVKPNRFFLSDNSIVANLTSYKPDKGGQNPTYAGLTADASYFRKFEVADVADAQTRIVSFKLIISGSFVTGSATGDLAAEHLRIFVRRIASADPADPSGPGSNALSLHGPLYDFNEFNDGAGNGQIRTDGPAGATVEGTFGGVAAKTGILVEVVLRNDAIRINQITFQPTF